MLHLVADVVVVVDHDHQPLRRIVVLVDAEDNDPSRRLMVVINYNNDIGDYMEHSAESFWPVNILDGPWGVGKSTFVKMWRAMLRERGIPSVYVDAFAQDYISDPFEALCGTFVRAAEAAHKEDTEEY